MVLGVINMTVCAYLKNLKIEMRSDLDVGFRELKLYVMYIYAGCDKVNGKCFELYCVFLIFHLNFFAFFFEN